MATYTDRSGTAHRLRIDGLICRKLKQETGIDLLECARSPKAIEHVLRQLNDPEVIMAACAVIEGVAADSVETFWASWDGDTFEAATSALLEAIADFFPKGPRAVFSAILSKAKAAVHRAQEIGTKKALQMIENEDWLLGQSG